MKTEFDINTEQNDHELIETYVGPMFLNVNESKHMRKRAEGVYEEKKTRVMERFIEPGMTVLDVGANKGWFTCLASRLVGQEGHVYSYEPIPTNYYWVNQTVDADDTRKNVTVLEYALGDCDGYTMFNIAGRSGGHTFMHRPKWNNDQLRVKIYRLDSRWFTVHRNKPIHAIKIDVEAAELRVLAGMERVLTCQPRLLLMIDVHIKMGVPIQRVVDVLACYGFRCYTEDLKPIRQRSSECHAIVAAKGEWKGLK